MGIIMKDGHQYGAGGIVEQAEDISYDNTSSGLSATNVQSAVDELKTGLTNLTIERVTNVEVSTASNITSEFRDSDKIVGIVITYQSYFLYCFQHRYNNRQYFHVFKVDSGVLKETGQMTINEAFIYRVE